MQELSLNILDIVQNSVRAQAKNVSVEVYARQAEDKLSLRISDDGCGMTEEQVRQVSDPFYTTRTTRKVGLGVSFLKMAAEMTGGGLQITSTPGKGTVVEACFGLSHIDRMPLGDMAQTMTALIQCNPEVEFCYRFTCDDRSFCADTKEFREVLEGVPLNEPQVLCFIGDYIKENTAEALNGAMV